MYIHMESHNALLPILADPARFKIITALQRGECSVGQITQAAGIAQSGVSRHLAILHRAGVFRDLEAWLAGFHDLWAARLDRFAGALTELQLNKVANLGRPDDRSLDDE
jgi:DNA-binding transcriptional ArsR family regulator